MMRFPGESRGEMNGVGDEDFIKCPFFPRVLRGVGRKRAGKGEERSSFILPSYS